MPKKLLKIFKGSMKEKVRLIKYQINTNKSQGRLDLQLAEKLKVLTKSCNKL
jgi:hypothetical protein